MIFQKKVETVNVFIWDGVDLQGLLLFLAFDITKSNLTEYIIILQAVNRSAIGDYITRDTLGRIQNTPAPQFLALYTSVVQALPPVIQPFIPPLPLV